MHHTSLCRDSSNEATTHEKKNIPDKSTDKKSVYDNTPTSGKFITPASCSEAPQNPTCLLKTAIAPIVAGNKPTFFWTRRHRDHSFQLKWQRNYTSPPHLTCLWHHSALLYISNYSNTWSCHCGGRNRIRAVDTNFRADCAINCSSDSEFSVYLHLQHATPKELKAGSPSLIREEVYDIIVDWNRPLLELH